MLDDTGFKDQEVKKAQREVSLNFPQGIRECGTDALRFTLCSYNFKGI